MSDDKSKTGEQDRSRISLSEDYEVQYWTKSLNVTTEELKDAVKKVRSNAREVKEYFSKK